MLVVRYKKARDLYHKSALKTKYLRYYGALLKNISDPVTCSSRGYSIGDDNNASLGGCPRGRYAAPRTSRTVCQVLENFKSAIVLLSLKI